MHVRTHSPLDAPAPSAISLVLEVFDCGTSMTMTLKCVSQCAPLFSSQEDSAARPQIWGEGGGGGWGARAGAVSVHVCGGADARAVARCYLRCDGEPELFRHRHGGALLL